MSLKSKKKGIFMNLKLVDFDNYIYATIAGSEIYSYDYIASNPQIKSNMLNKVKKLKGDFLSNLQEKKQCVEELKKSNVFSSSHKLFSFGQIFLAYLDELSNIHRLIYPENESECKLDLKKAKVAIAKYRDRSEVEFPKEVFDFLDKNFNQLKKAFDYPEKIQKTCNLFFNIVSDSFCFDLPIALLEYHFEKKDITEVEKSFVFLNKTQDVFFSNAQIFHSVHFANSLIVKNSEYLIDYFVKVKSDFCNEYSDLLDCLKKEDQEFDDGFSKEILKVSNFLKNFVDVVIPMSNKLLLKNTINSKQERSKIIKEIKKSELDLIANYDVLSIPESSFGEFSCDLFNKEIKEESSILGLECNKVIGDKFVFFEILKKMQKKHEFVDLFKFKLMACRQNIELDIFRMKIDLFVTSYLCCLEKIFNGDVVFVSKNTKKSKYKTEDNFFDKKMFSTSVFNETFLSKYIMEEKKIEKKNKSCKKKSDLKQFEKKDKVFKQKSHLNLKNDLYISEEKNNYAVPLKEIVVVNKKISKECLLSNLLNVAIKKERNCEKIKYLLNARWHFVALKSFSSFCLKNGSGDSNSYISVVGHATWLVEQLYWRKLQTKTAVSTHNLLVLHQSISTEGQKIPGVCQKLYGGNFWSRFPIIEYEKWQESQGYASTLTPQTLSHIFKSLKSPTEFNSMDNEIRKICEEIFNQAIFLLDEKEKIEEFSDDVSCRFKNTEFNFHELSVNLKEINSLLVDLLECLKQESKQLCLHVLQAQMNTRLILENFKILEGSETYEIWGTSSIRHMMLLHLQIESLMLALCIAKTGKHPPHADYRHDLEKLAVAADLPKMTIYGELKTAQQQGRYPYTTSADSKVSRMIMGVQTLIENPNGDDGFTLCSRGGVKTKIDSQEIILNLHQLTQDGLKCAFELIIMLKDMYKKGKR